MGRIERVMTYLAEEERSISKREPLCWRSFSFDTENLVPPFEEENKERRKEWRRDVRVSKLI